MIAHRVPKFESIRLERSWAGHYAENVFDGNMIIGALTPEIGNLRTACGFSGHGVMHAPAVGRAPQPTGLVALPSNDGRGVRAGDIGALDWRTSVGVAFRAVVGQRQLKLFRWSIDMTQFGLPGSMCSAPGVGPVAMGISKLPSAATWNSVWFIAEMTPSFQSPSVLPV